MNSAPQGLKARWRWWLMYGLKPVPTSVYLAGRLDGMTKERPALHGVWRLDRAALGLRPTQLMKSVMG